MGKKLLELNEAADKIVEARKHFVKCDAQENEAKRKARDALLALLAAEDNFNRIRADYEKG